jgi:RNA polymerase primary sigma factor
MAEVLERVESIQLYLAEINAIPRLTHAEECALALRIQAGDRLAKQRFILANLRLVVAVAKGYGTEDLDLLDHIQNGYFGLVKAVEQFDPGRNLRFSTYAMWWIRQAIARGCQMNARLVHLPVYIQDQLRSLSRVSDDWLQTHGTEPSAEVLAESLGIEVEQVRLLQSSRAGVMSLDRTCEWEEEEGPAYAECIADPGAEAAYAQVDGTSASLERSAVLHCALAHLTERERTVVKLYFGLGCDAVPSHARIGRMIGVSRARVQQILQHALQKLRGSPALAGGEMPGEVEVLV